jgi:phage minor structural protein
MIYLLDRQETVRGILSNEILNTCPYYEDYLTENLTDYRLTYEFKVPANHDTAALVKEGCYFVRAGLDGEFLMFRIRITKSDVDEKGTYIYVYGESAGLELLTQPCRPANLVSQSPEMIFKYLLNGSRWSLGKTEVGGTANFTFTDYTTVLEKLPEVAAAFKGELKYRVELKNGQVTGRYIDLVERRGSVTGKRFTVGKDVTGLTKTVDTTNLFTALIGIGPADETGSFMTFAKLNSVMYDKPAGQDWIGDNSALQLWGDGDKHLIGFVKFDNAENPEHLMDLTFEKLQETKNPVITYDFKVVLLGQLLGYEWEEIRLGDTIGLYDISFAEPILLNARIQETKISFTNPQNSTVTLSDYVPAKTNINEDMKKLQDSLLKNQLTWNKANNANSKASSGIYESGVHKLAKPPVFTRNSVRTYKGLDYAVNAPIYDYGGIIVDPEQGENLTIQTANVLYADEGTIEAKITPLKLVDFNNLFRMEYNSSSRFLVYMNAAGRVYFSIDNWSAGYVRTSEGVAQVGKPVKIAVRWSDKSKTYTLFVNGELIGTNYYSKSVFGEFPQTMNVVYNYGCVISDLRISKTARGDVEIMKG